MTLVPVLREGVDGAPVFRAASAWAADRVGLRRRVGAGAGAAPEIILDLSRLLSRVLHPTPTGVDRVEMAYAQWLTALSPERLRFAAVHPSGAYGRLSTAAARRFIDATVDRWGRQGGEEGQLQRWTRAARAMAGFTPLPSCGSGDRPRVYLHLSARALERTALFRGVLRSERARLISFVHDLIPLQFPEYARPNGAALFQRKLATVTGLASGVLVNSQATAAALAPYMAKAGNAAPVRVAPLGALWTGGDARPAPEPPYFVAIGTIEPRKNHLLLLNLWRRLAETRPLADVPKLVLIGRRGWENENILDLLDRSPRLRQVVEERRGLTDQQVRAAVESARAVLIPSFAEGFGLPVVEALALGAPVVASDIPALREAGAGAPDYLDPLDGVAWMQAILDYAAPNSLRRAAQMQRLSRWRAPTWEEHVRIALDLVETVCA